MRVNVYAEEMTDRIEIIEKEIDGHTFTAVRFYLELPVTVGQAADGEPINKQGPFMHRAGDDDSAAVTFWGKRNLRRILRKALDKLDQHYGEADNATHLTSASKIWYGVDSPEPAGESRVAAVVEALRKASVEADPMGEYPFSLSLKFRTHEDRVAFFDALAAWEET